VETANRNGSGCRHHRRVHLAADGDLLKIFITVVMVNYFAVPPMQVEDKLGPWKTPMECYLRGADIIREITAKARVLSAHTLCIEREQKEEKNI